MEYSISLNTPYLRGTHPNPEGLYPVLHWQRYEPSIFMHWEYFGHPVVLHSSMSTHAFLLSFTLYPTSHLIKMKSIQSLFETSPLPSFSVLNIDKTLILAHIVPTCGFEFIFSFSFNTLNEGAEWVNIKVLTIFIYSEFLKPCHKR